MLESQTLNYIKAKKIKFREFSFDTRSLKKRDIFFAIDGSSDNGNNFILDAKKAISNNNFDKWSKDFLSNYNSK